MLLVFMTNRDGISVTVDRIQQAFLFCGYPQLRTFHDDVIKWKHVPRYWPFVRGIHRSPVNSLHKGQWRGALMFSLIWVRLNGWVNNREAGDLSRRRAHYDVTAMYRFYDQLGCYWICMAGLWHRCIALCVNLLWPNVTIWRHGSWSTLIQVMACRLMAPSHCLKQFWHQSDTHRGTHGCWWNCIWNRKRDRHWWTLALWQTGGCECKTGVSW